MVEQKVHTHRPSDGWSPRPNYTSNKSHVEIGKEFNTSAASVSRWSRLYRPDFLGELSIRLQSATFNAGSNLSPAMNKPDLTLAQDRGMGSEQTPYSDQHDGKRRTANPLTERVNGILKTEWLDKRPPRNWSETQAYVE